MTLLGPTEMALAGSIFVLAAFWGAFVLPSWPSMVFALLLAFMLSILLAIDSRHMVLPNPLNFLLAVSGLLASWLLQDGEILERLLAVALGFSVLALVSSAYRRIRNRDGLGLGDAKLLGALGAWVGLGGLASVLFIGALAGLGFALCRAMVMGTPSLRRKLPFGPFLAISGWMVWLYGPLI
jgi:leader peptidase (prepilin peptidase)/N-methyltransferase